MKNSTLVKKRPSARKSGATRKTSTYQEIEQKHSRSPTDIENNINQPNTRGSQTPCVANTGGNYKNHKSSKGKKRKAPFIPINACIVESDEKKGNE